MHGVSLDLQHNQEEPTAILCDLKITITLSKLHVFHKRVEHIDTRYHFIMESINKGKIYLEFCKFEDQLTYILDQALPNSKFQYLQEKMVIIDIKFVNDRN